MSSVSCVFRIKIIKLREITLSKGSHWVANIMKGERFLSALTEPK